MQAIWGAEESSVVAWVHQQLLQTLPSSSFGCGCSRPSLDSQYGCSLVSGCWESVWEREGWSVTRASPGLRSCIWAHPGPWSLSELHCRGAYVRPCAMLTIWFAFLDWPRTCLITTDLSGMEYCLLLVVIPTYSAPLAWAPWDKALGWGSLSCLFCCPLSPASSSSSSLTEQLLDCSSLTRSTGKPGLFLHY